MANQALPNLDDMLQSLLLMEEGEHELSAEDEGVQELRHLFFPVTRRATYLNHAADGPLARPVARTLHEAVDDMASYGNIHLGRWSEYERGAHRRLAALLNVRPEQVALTASTGDGLQIVAQGLSWRAGDEIVSAEGEFPSNVYPWLNLSEQGVTRVEVPLREYRAPVEDVLARLTERTRLVTLSVVEFATGFRNDIATIARHCHERGIWCGVDAMQAVGMLDLDIQALGVDFLAAAAHKWLLGPLMCGILYVSDALLPHLRVARRGWFSVESPFDFSSYEQALKAGAARFEHSTSNLLPILGLDAALGLFECLDGGMAAVEARILGLTAHAIEGLERLGYPVISPRGAGERSGIVCFLPRAERPEWGVTQIVSELTERNIHIAARGSVARVSPHFYNTIEEIDALLNALEETARTE